eukprot:CAMPEP_0185760322 /NCGR_PEP_ID=MMETSP1174-20130828/19181_1 /TAXON_ID=35687 /ORGANISM="Dictyocha speculum, Strain CCMP1381" /LENGTH=96 /DNA_ID=CAMNT_0028441075 /DNA_START=193 /DNA_END=480 /DNA_ORIENTATION=+
MRHAAEVSKEPAHIDADNDQAMPFQITSEYVGGSLQSTDCQEVKILMFDSWADGWQGNYLYLGDQKVTLDGGGKGNTTVCLDVGRYTPWCCGGMWA